DGRGTPSAWPRGLCRPRHGPRTIHRRHTLAFRFRPETGVSGRSACLAPPQGRSAGRVTAEHEADGVEDLAGRERLGDVVVGAALVAGEHVLVLALGGHHY